MMNSILITLTSFFAVSSVSGHMAVSNPPPRDSKLNKNTLRDNINYSLVAPVEKFGCSQFHQTAPVVTYQAGQNATFTIEGGAPHNGGSCQFGLSYDGERFITLLDVVGNCLVDKLTYSFGIPKDAPNGNAVVGWFWINRTGNREYYMNCVDAKIEGGSDNAQLSGRSISIANLPGYTTIPEGESGIPLTAALYSKAETITISQGSGSGGYPVKVNAQVPNVPQKTQVDEQKYDQAPPSAPQPTQPTQPKQQQDPAPAAAPAPVPDYNENPLNKPLVELMKCKAGPPFCEDGKTYAQCSGDRIYRKFCGSGTKCVINETVANCLPLNY